MTRRWLLGVAAVSATMLVVAGCSKPTEQGRTPPGPGPVVAQPGPNTEGRPGLPAANQPTTPAKPGLIAPQPGTTAAAPGAASGGAWDQIRAARMGIRSYKSTVQQGQQTATQYMKMQNGKPVRMRVDTPQGWILVQLDKKLLYAYNPEQKVAMKTSTDTGMMSKNGKLELDDLTILQKQKAKVTSGTLDGMDCWIFDVTGKQPATMWIDKRQGMVQQRKQADQVLRFKIQDVNGVADSEFEVPSGVKVQDMAEMMKSMKGMKGMPAPPR